MAKGKIVLASGTFDILHPGHIKYLEAAKKAGGKNAKLIVIVTRDSLAERRRGKKPVLPEGQRRFLVEALKVVDEAFLGYEEPGEIGNVRKVIEKIKPDVIAVGHDQDDVEREVRRVVAEMGLNIEIVKIGAFGEDELSSSSKIKRKIVENYQGWHS
ncbi:MAG: adenylyltransferase/cytidyltransferase family protein [Candidatus Bathyarchaeia archaeon]